MGETILPEGALRMRGRTALMLGIGIVILGILAVIASAVGTQTSGDRVHYGFMSLVPAAVAIGLAFATRNVLLSLFMGILSGGVIYAFGAVDLGSSAMDFPYARTNVLETFILPTVGSSGFAIILVVYLWCLGGLIGLWGKTGGALRFTEWMGDKMVRGPRTAKLFGWLVGVIFHQGGTISTLLAGTTVRPLLDKEKISKEEASYIVDSTASPVATVVPFNVYPFVIAAAVAGTIPLFPADDGTQASLSAGVTFFFENLYFNFYPILAVLSTLLLSLNILPAIGGIRRARKRVEETGEIVRPGSSPMTSEELSTVEIEPGYKSGLADFLMPIMFLLGIAMIPYFIVRGINVARTGLPGEPPLYITEAFFAALLVGIFVAVAKGMPFQKALDGVINGAKGVTFAAMILALALTMKSVGDALGVGAYVADVLGDTPKAILPVLLMFAAGVVAFSTGTSFGTWSILFPAAIPLAFAVGNGDTTYLGLCFGAVISGAVWGDQTSPISDTTILSSVATGTDLMDHVTSQIPYAAIAGGLAAVGYFILGATL
ncbi:MAG: Na+/H+ antiporter NhaC family protein [Thermoplasmatota archaeon]